MLVKMVRRADAAKGRIDACSDVPLPAKYERYLDTSFLGLERSIDVGQVTYSYHRFGPMKQLAIGSSGTVRITCMSLFYSVVPIRESRSRGQPSIASVEFTSTELAFVSDMQA